MAFRSSIWNSIVVSIMLTMIISAVFPGCSNSPAKSGTVYNSQSTLETKESRKNSTSTKYFSYVNPLPIEPGPIHGPWVDFQGEQYDNSDCRFIHRFITKPVDMVPFAHSHNFTEFMMFYGSDPEDISDFKAEIEIYIGEGQEKERFIITSPTVLYFPAGLAHCPLNFKIVNETITMVIIALTPRYDVPHIGH